ncbi:MAG: PKD domain-containing protein [Parcubacteria group bacterium]
MKKFIPVFIIILSVLISKPVFAEVTQFVFVTPVQNIAVSTLSDTITIQSQNSTGVPEDITETSDIEFTSSSLTGEFLSTSGNAVSKTMSRNTTNKNFVYRDSSSGAHTITIKATGRTSLNVFTATQVINVGAGSVSSTTNSTTTIEDTVTPTPAPQIAYSSHSSPSPLSNTENKMEFEVSAGRSRLTSVGSQVSFAGDPTRLQNVGVQSISYEWSFGDGATALGQVVSHAYAFPGEYVVVLNARSSDKQAVSRTSVKVVEPQLVLSRVELGTEVTNKSSSEVNLGGWSFVSKNKTFVFPKDTILLSNKSIVFSDSTTGFDSSTQIKILNPLGKLFGSVDPVNDTRITKEVKPLSESELQNIQASLDKVKTELAKISPKSASKVVTVKKVEPVEPKEVVYPAEDNSDQLANTVSMFEGKKETGLISSILSWPIIGINLIKHVFVEGD